MLKAHMINKFGVASIYYSDKPNRTLSLENCVQKVFTNEKAPLRKNLEKMIEFHRVDMTRVMPENFITLSVCMKSLNETEIRGKYEEQVAEKLVSVQQALEPMVVENNSAFAIRG